MELREFKRVRMVRNWTVHVSFWFVLMLLIQWMKTYRFQRKKEKSFHARSQQIGLEGSSDKTEYMSTHQEQMQSDVTANNWWEVPWDFGKLKYWKNTNKSKLYLWGKWQKIELGKFLLYFLAESFVFSFVLQKNKSDIFTFFPCCMQVSNLVSHTKGGI